MIVDEYGSLEGIITLKDVLEAIIGNLPETRQKPKYFKRADGSFLLDGMLVIREVEDILNVKNIKSKRAWCLIFIVWFLFSLILFRKSFN